MLVFLIEYIIRCFNIKVPLVFYYSSTRMMLAAMTSLIFVIFLGPYFIKKLYQFKIGENVRTVSDCPTLAKLHNKKKDTPTMGGVLIICSILLSLVLWMDLSKTFTIILLFTTLFLGGVGGLDDFLKLKYKNSKGLKSRYKFLLQVLFGCLIASYLIFPSITSFISQKTTYSAPTAKEYSYKYQTSSHKFLEKVNKLKTKEYISRIYIPFFKDPILILKGSMIFVLFIWIVFVVVGSSNAVNLTDGLDGLASGCIIMVACVLALLAFLSNHVQMAKYLNILYIKGSGEIAIYLCAIAGAVLGFLWYNGYPAQVFMGDTGSLSLGGILGVSAILLKKEILLGLVGGIFVIEALSVILQVLSFRFRNKKRLFLCAPLHHHFEYKGWPETKVTLRFWIVGLLLAIIGLSSIKFQ